MKKFTILTSLCSIIHIRLLCSAYHLALFLFNPQNTKLTGEQLAGAGNITYIRLTTEQYNNVKTSLPKGTTVYVDGNYTRI